MTEEDEGTSVEEQRASLPRHLMTVGTSMQSIADTEAESTTPLTGFERVDDASPNGDEQTAEVEQEVASTLVEMAGPIESSTRASDMNVKDEMLPDAEEAKKEAKPPAPASPIDADENKDGKDVDERVTSSPSDATKNENVANDEKATSDSNRENITESNLPPWVTQNEVSNAKEQHEEKDESDAGAVAAGVAAGAIAVGAITAGVLASKDDEKGEPKIQKADAVRSNNVGESSPCVDTSKEKARADATRSVQRTEDGHTTPSKHHSGLQVAALVSLFEKEQKKNASKEELVTETNDQNPTESAKVHLLEGFTTEEESDDDLFKPEIPQNLKAANGHGLRRGDSEFDGIEDQGSVKTTEFPASDDEMPTAASFDNVVVVVVNLPDESNDTKEVKAEIAPVSTTDTDEKDAAVPVTTAGSVTDIRSEGKAAKIGGERPEHKPVQVGEPQAANAVDGPVANDSSARTSLVEQQSESFFPVTNEDGLDAAAEVENFDSWRTDDTQDESNSFLPPKEFKTKQEDSQGDSDDAPVTFPSLLGNTAGLGRENSDTEGEPLLPDGKKDSDDAVPLTGMRKAKAMQAAPEPTITYKIGSTYFLLRERDGIEYPVKILSLSKHGTCIVEYLHHRAKKKIRTSSLLPDTPERQKKFDELMNSGEIANDLPARISKELKQKQSERHARHDERRRYGHHISRENLPICSTEGTVLEFKSRRVYFARDRETVRDISKKFNVPSDQIIFDNKVAYPTLKKSSRLRPLTSIVLPPE